MNDGEPVDSLLVREWSAVLAGRYAEQLEATGAEVPPWAWLNLLAHGTEADLRRAAHPAGNGLPGDHSRPWRQARSYLAAEVIDVVERECWTVHQLQSEGLVPLELRLSAPARSSWWAPGQLVATVLAVLHEPRLRRHAS